MTLTNKQKIGISEIVKNILLIKINDIPDLIPEIKKFPIYRDIFNKIKKDYENLEIELPHLVGISIWLHKFNLSIDTGFDRIANIISGGFTRKFSEHFPLVVKTTQIKNIKNIIENLKSGKSQPNVNKEEKSIYNFLSQEKEITSPPFIIDNYIETDKTIEAINIITIIPDFEFSRGEKQKILYAKAAFKLLNPQKEIKFFIGFPFDPTSKTPTGYDKERFFNYLIEFKKFFAPEETLIGGELWDYLSGGKNTMEEILEVITETVKKLNDK